jgi:hypothetical protein
MNGQPLVLDNYTMMRGKPLRPDQNMAKITRVVLLETGNFSVFDGRSLTTDSANSSHANINFAGPATENLIIQITNFNSGSNAKFVNASINGSTLSSSDYTVLRRPLYGNFSSYSSSSTLLDNDSLYIGFNKDLFPSNKSYQVRLNFHNLTFTQQGPLYSSYGDNIQKIYESAQLVVEVW